MPLYLQVIFFTVYNSYIFRTVVEETQRRSEIRNHSSSDASRAAHDFSPNSPSPVSNIDAAKANRVKLISTTDQRESAASAHRMTNPDTALVNSIQLPLRNIGVADNGQCRSIDSGIPFARTGCAQTENPCSPLEGAGFATESNNIHVLLQDENLG